jgi:hypothetical protein
MCLMITVSEGEQNIFFSLLTVPRGYVTVTQDDGFAVA